MFQKLSWFYVCLAVIVTIASIPAVQAGGCEADSIQKYVDQATKTINAKGKNGFNELGELKYCDGQGYVYVQDLSGVMQYHPILPHLVGKNVASMKDANGKLFAVEMLKNVKSNGETWFTYMWPKPGAKTPSLKCGYAKKASLDGQDVLVASGLYDIEEGQCNGN